ncbi:MAG TPA: hypothetical protein VMB73_35480 [Acetobacteraceae bacterium]|nr:hypothetical protein [Acetobacteraceae bacterium]
MLLHIRAKIMDDGGTQVIGLRQQEVAAFILGQPEFRCVCEDARLIPDRLEHAAIIEILRPMVRQHSAHRDAPDFEDPLNLADLADEEAAEFLRQQRNDEAVMFVLRAYQRPHIRSRTTMHTIGKWQWHCNLLRQTQLLAGKECDASAEFGQFGFHSVLDPIEFFLQNLPRAPVIDRLQRCIRHACQVGPPSAAGASVQR